MQPQPPANAILRIGVVPLLAGQPAARYTMVEAIHPLPRNNSEEERQRVMAASTKISLAGVHHANREWHLTAHNVPDVAVRAMRMGWECILHLWTKPLDSPGYTQILMPRLTHITITNTNRNDSSHDITANAEPAPYPPLPYLLPSEDEQLSWDEPIAIRICPSAALPAVTEDVPVRHGIE